MQDDVTVSTEHGISREIKWLERGIIVPPKRRSFRQTAGVLTAQGVAIPHSNTWAPTGPLNRPPEMPEMVEDLAGCHLYAGMLNNHFGHAITEGLARFWAFAHMADTDIQSVLYTPHNPARPGVVLPVMETIRDLCGVSIPMRMITAPTRVERLCCPGPGFGLGALATGTPEFQSFFAERFAKTVPPGPHRKLYLSRSKLDPLLGGALNETDLERVLQDDGFHILHPEQHPLEHQISMIKGAQIVVGLDGSALHLVALLSVPHQTVAAIMRNPIRSQPAEMMVEQIAAMDPTKTVSRVTSLCAFHRQRGLRRGSREGLATLNLAETIAQLRDLGVVSATLSADLPAPDLSATRAFLDRQPDEFEEWLY